MLQVDRQISFADMLIFIFSTCLIEANALYLLPILVCFFENKPSSINLSLSTWSKMTLCDNKGNLFFYLKGNPWKDVISDDQVMQYWEMFRTRSSMKAVAAGLPDFLCTKFAILFCTGIIWNYNLSREVVIAYQHRYYDI